MTVTETVAETGTETGPEKTRPEGPPPEPPTVELEQLQEAWQRSVLPAVEQRSIPTASMLREAHPAALDGDTLTLEFPQSAAFHRKLAEEEKNAGLLRDALYEVTGMRLAVQFALMEDEDDSRAEEEPVSEEDLLALLKQEFDAREVDE